MHPRKKDVGAEGVRIVTRKPQFGVTAGNRTTRCGFGDSEAAR